MKYLIIVFSFFLLSCNKTLYSNPIGCDIEVKFGKTIEKRHAVMLDTITLKTEWNKIIMNNKIEGEVSHFSIRTGVDEMTENIYYYLIASSHDMKIKIATKLIKHKNKYYLNKNELLYSICYGSSSCDPVIYNNEWECDTRDLINCKKLEVAKF
jgi:hypothetical protein